MSKRIATAVAILGAAGLVSGCYIEQPSAGCIVQDATDYPWQAVYILKDSADAAKSCGQLKGEALGVFKFVNPYPDKHPEAPKSRLAIRPAGTASRFEYTYSYTKDGEETEETVARVDLEGLSATEALKVQQAATGMSASLADQPDDKGLCKATGFEAATINASEVRHVQTNEVLVPAENISYTFSDINVYSAPSAPGTQLEGTMTYSDGAGCQATYRVLALWPQVPCDPESTEPANSCGVGSGLNPDFDAVCVAGIGPDGEGGCVPNPAKGVPSFK